VTDMEQELSACKADLSVIREQIVRLDHALRGNGSRGLFTEFELLKSRVTQLEEFKTDMKRTKQWAATAALSMMGQLAWLVLTNLS
jgi:hypothetical protein